MVKSSNKSIWLGMLVLLGLTVLAFKMALAITAFTPANQPVGYVAQDDITNYNLTSGTEVLYRGQYEKQYWGGNLIAYAVNSAGDISTASQPWNGGAANQIELQSSRLIVTLRSDGTKIPFQWTSLSTTQQGYLTSSAILDFLRGDHSNEVQMGIGTLRQRASALGDIVHSRPYYLSDSTSSTPAPTVFVGANDGMLHAFDAVTGNERWAYVPSMLISKMQNLSVAPYVHDYYVDGSVIVATILSGSKRVLVGALGAGGKGLFALDITGSSRLAPTTESAAADNILWEITPTSINNVANTTYANLGYTYANPSIAKVADVDAVIVGNGYNNGGDYQAYLYVINANTGVLISAIKAGTSGTASSPNGLSTPVAIDTNNDGNVEIVYAGDLNGTMWKFDLTASTATVLLTTSPAQPITMSPGVAKHPNGGYMVDFATGAMLATADTTDASVFAAYGIWDGAPSANTVLLTQTLTERCYTSGTTVAATPCASRVRTVSVNQPDWTSGATHHKGWRVALPAGEKVVGDGSFIENGRFYFNGYNPTVANTVQTSTVYGENWLMELDYLTGGAPVANLPFLDLSGNHILDDDDRVKFATPPTVPTDSIPIGKMIGIGVMSQPVLVQLSTLNNTLFNQNPDVPFVPVPTPPTGVTGGHFDVDYFYAPPTGGARASATITVGTTGQTNPFPATLGAITVNGVTIVPALTVTDIPNGTSSSTNATTIMNKVTGGFTATRSGSVITITAPMGDQFNGQAISIAAGTSQTLVTAQAAVPAVVGVTGVAPTAGTLVITAVDKNTTVSIKCGSTYVGSSGTFTSSNSNTASTRLDALYTSINNTVNGYATSCTKTTSGGVTTRLNCTIAAPVGVSACNSGFTVDSNINDTTNTGPAGGVNPVTAVVGSPAIPQSGWTNFAPALTATAFNSSGLEPTSVGDTCNGSTITYPTVTNQSPGAYYPSGSGPSCTYDVHFHRYDKVFDVTGVNMLNPSSTSLLIGNSIPSLNQNFKVLAQNQYLNPAVELHIGDPTYLYNVDHGYIQLKDYATSSTLDLATLQTYRRDPNAAWPGSATTAAQKLAQPKPIGSLTFNMPVDALSAKNWWGNGDIRAGLIPTTPQCVWAASGTHDGNMYQPVIPPTNGVDGPATNGWSNSTTPATATGARHGGALVIQLIRDTTPNSAIELNVAGRPEYGWRVKSSVYSSWVLAEYATYWHHPLGKCFNSSGWTKTPVADNSTAPQSSKAVGSTDPKIGNLAGTINGNGATVTAVDTNVVGNVTTTVYTFSDGTTATMQVTANANGTVTTETWGSNQSINYTSVTTANPQGSLRTGGDERARQAARTGRISWRELVAP